MAPDTDSPPPAAPPRIFPLVLGAVLVAASLALPTWRFGRRFLLQFFVSPFQFFIVVPWFFAVYGLRTGTMPMKSGPALRRESDPASYWMSVMFYAAAGAAMFAFNLWVSWTVVSR
ncbi:MAG: hypothetical protein HY078_09390 [Elusimicrobia bacterium]|nr:hypothetical protein [Elusimicrobiota bacterium]